MESDFTTFPVDCLYRLVVKNMGTCQHCGSTLWRSKPKKGHVYKVCDAVCSNARRHQRFTAEEETKIAEMHTKGFGCGRIAREIGHTKFNVRQALERLGIGVHKGTVWNKGTGSMTAEAIIMDGYRMETRALAKYDESRHWAAHTLPRQKRIIRASSQRTLKCALQTKMWKTIKYGHTGGRVRTIEGVVGCDRTTFMDHLQKQFRPGMAWNNYGPVWEIDHIRPCNDFDLLDPEEQQRCFHYTNLQPLFKTENRRKWASYVSTPTDERG